MLKMFFETKTKFGGKIIDISIISEWNKAIVEFDDSIGKKAYKVELLMFIFVKKIDMFFLMRRNKTTILILPV
jgi:hypothetical protein